MPRKANEANKPSHTVVMPFQDLPEHAGENGVQQYNEGDDVSHFDAERIALLIERGIVKANATETKETEETED